MMDRWNCEKCGEVITAISCEGMHVTGHMGLGAKVYHKGCVTLETLSRENFEPNSKVDWLIEHLKRNDQEVRTLRWKCQVLKNATVGLMRQAGESDSSIDDFRADFDIYSQPDGVLDD